MAGKSKELDVKKKKLIRVYPHEYLTKEERKNFKKDHPGYKLAFPRRFPYAVIYLDLIAIAISIIAMLK